MPPPSSQQDLLARLDERMGHVLASIEGMKDDIRDVRENFVSKNEFQPVRAIVFGAVALILVSFMGAILYLTGLKG